LFVATGAMRVATLFMLAAIAGVGVRDRLRRIAGLDLQPLSPRPGASSIDLPIVEDLAGDSERDEEIDRDRLE